MRPYNLNHSIERYLQKSASLGRRELNTMLSPSLRVLWTRVVRGIPNGFAGISEKRHILAADFTANPERVVTLFGTNGLPLGSPVTFQNA